MTMKQHIYHLIVENKSIKNFLNGIKIVIVFFLSLSTLDLKRNSLFHEQDTRTTRLIFELAIYHL
jgi:chromate transport protein ChrA